MDIGVLKEKFSELVQRVGEEEWKRFLRFRKGFREYSLLNTFLIFSQRPDATIVRGYRAWQEIGRWVKRGEKGIAILAPILVKKKVVKEEGETEEEETLVGFRTVYVFDVAQTDGAPLPQVWKDIKEEKSGGELFPRLKALAEEIGFRVAVKPLIDKAGEANMTSENITIDEKLDDGGKSHALVHEIAHAILHKDVDIPRWLAELEAETTAFLCLDVLGVDVSAFSFPYVFSFLPSENSVWTALTKCFGRIDKAVGIILDRLKASA